MQEWHFVQHLGYKQRRKNFCLRSLQTDVYSTIAWFGEISKRLPVNSAEWTYIIFFIKEKVQ